MLVALRNRYTPSDATRIRELKLKYEKSASYLTVESFKFFYRKESDEIAYKLMAKYEIRDLGDLTHSRSPEQEGMDHA